MKLFDLSGKTAFVSGGSRGIGKAIALGLAEVGANVAVGARTASDIDVVVAQIEEAGVRGLAVPLDVSGIDAIPAAVVGTDLITTRCLGTQSIHNQEIFRAFWDIFRDLSGEIRYGARARREERSL